MFIGQLSCINALSRMSTTEHKRKKRKREKNNEEKKGSLIYHPLTDNSTHRNNIRDSRVARISQRGEGPFWEFDTTVNKLDPNFHWCWS